MGYWLNEPTIHDPSRLVAGVRELAASGYKVVRVMLRNTNYSHLSPQVVAAVDAGARAAVDAGIRLVLDCEPHSKPVAAEMNRLYPGSAGTRLVLGKANLFNGAFSVPVPTPRCEGGMAIWDGVECAFIHAGGKVTKLPDLAVNVDWETEVYNEGDTRRSQPYQEGKASSMRYVCRVTGTVPGHADGTLIFYARFLDNGLTDFWAPGFRSYFSQLLDAYRDVPLGGTGWDEPAVGGDWSNYRYGKSFAEAFERRNGYALADRAYLLDWPGTTPESARVRLDYYDTLNAGLVDAQAELVAKTRELFGDDALLGTHHTWQGEGGINDYRAGAVDYFQLADTQDAGYTDCCWWDEASVCYAYALGTSLGRLSPTGETEVNTWHWKPSVALTQFNARFMSLNNVTWFNIWFGDNADTCQYPGHYTWNECRSAAARHDGIQERLAGLAPVTEIAVWHGWESVAAMNDPRFAGAHKTCVMNISKLFSNRNVTFDFIDSRLLAASEVNGDLLTNRLGAYKVLVMPYASVLPAAAWEVCKQFAASGGRLVFVGPPPSMTTEGADIADEFAAVAGLSTPLTLPDYVGALESRYALPAYRAAYLDCSVPLTGIASTLLTSVEGEPHAAESGDGHVVYLTDLDPRERLLDTVEPWLNPPIACHGDSILWKAYQDGDSFLVVLIAKEGRTMDGVIEAAGHAIRIWGGTTALLTIANGEISVEANDVSWKQLA
jgi:hypothetical protein